MSTSEPNDRLPLPLQAVMCLAVPGGVALLAFLLWLLVTWGDGVAAVAQRPWVLAVPVAALLAALPLQYRFLVRARALGLVPDAHAPGLVTAASVGGLVLAVTILLTVPKSWLDDGGQHRSGGRVVRGVSFGEVLAVAPAAALTLAALAYGRRRGISSPRGA